MADWMETGTMGAPIEVCQRVYAYLAAAVAQGEAWNWGQAEKNLRAAYRCLGAEPVGTGYDWHCGRHPIQIAAKNIVNK